MTMVPMKIKKTILFLLFSTTIGISGVVGQQALSSSGADITGDSGSVCYTLGQLLYSTDTGDSGSTTHGVQQVNRLCAGDLTGDGIVNTYDLLTLLVYIPCSENCVVDFNSDGVSDINDLLYFLGIFGTVCSP